VNLTTEPTASTFSFARFFEEVRVIVPKDAGPTRVEWLPDGRTRLVLRELEDGRGDLSDAGYYDQAHLIADFRDLVGLTPGAFRRRADDLAVSRMDCVA
jgi:AraC-like DNA-binding protein